jgi:hypothetical protein
MPKLSVYFIRAALLHLGIGFTLGALLLANKGIPFAGWIWRLLGLHIEFLIFGWMVQLAMGVAFFALPRHTDYSRRYGDVRLGWLSFILLNSGVWLTALARWFGTNDFAFGGRIILLLAAAAFAILIKPRVKAFGVHQ